MWKSVILLLCVWLVRIESFAVVSPHKVTVQSSKNRSPNSEISSVQELALMSWPEVKAWVKERGDIVPAILPIGATEQHGPSGLIGTDHQTAAEVARRVCAATGSMLLPTLPYGMSVHHSGFPGTMTLSPTTYAAVISDLTASLRDCGFNRIMILNGHGGNIGPASWALSELLSRPPVEPTKNSDPLPNTNVTNSNTAPPKEDASSLEPPPDLQIETHAANSAVNATVGSKSSDSETKEGSAAVNDAVKRRPSGTVMLHSWYRGQEVSTLAKGLYGDSLGQHATPDEVAITQYLFPDHIKTASLDPAAIRVAKELGGSTKRVADPSGHFALSYMSPVDFKARFPDGRMGSDPSLASPEAGQLLLEAAVRDAVAIMKAWCSSP